MGKSWRRHHDHAQLADLGVRSESGDIGIHLVLPCSNKSVRSPLKMSFCVGRD
ncbi:hypothetical protein PSAB6_230053 [Paraburkholderia sabiae]|nr:hypothetical protein PSAB6_230053 [Paraburkholderia sabiae]